MNLPKTQKANSGFTLIELLIVVSILAILAVVSLYVIGNVLPNTRDARRRADVQKISHALEVGKSNSANGQYVTLVSSMFSTGEVPEDPIAANNYCMTSTTWEIPVIPINGPWTSCQGTTEGVNAGNGYKALSAWTANTQIWKVCGWLEAGSSFCVQNVQ